MKSILSTFFLVLSGLVLQAQKLDFEHISTRQGLSHSTVYAITQDQRGFMWIGTREGLNRYDSSLLLEPISLMLFDNEEM